MLTLSSGWLNLGLGLKTRDGLGLALGLELGDRVTDRVWLGLSLGLGC